MNLGFLIFIFLQLQIGFNRNEEPGFGYFDVIRVDYTGMISTRRLNCVGLL